MYLPEVELERALVEAEQESEVAALQQEKDALEALHAKMSDLETKSQLEKEKVFLKVTLHCKTMSHNGERASTGRLRIGRRILCKVRVFVSCSISLPTVVCLHLFRKLHTLLSFI